MRYIVLLKLIIPVFILAASAWATPVQFTGDLPPMGAYIPGVPSYQWNYGCSPTSGGMIMGYWDGHPSGYWSNLVDGDVSTDNAAAKKMVASPEHVNDYWGEPDPHPDGTHEDNSIADFMHTSRSKYGLTDGATVSYMIPVGLKEYANWDDPGTVVNESYSANSWIEDVMFRSGVFTWNAFKSEIDAGYPMLIDLIDWHGSDGWYGHTVVGYGYQEEMFQLRIYDGDPVNPWKNITVGGFAVWDTWGTTSSNSYWLDWNGNSIGSRYIGGIEWWPFLDLSLSNGYNLDSGLWDWEITQGVYFHPGSAVPEPATIFLLASGIGSIFACKYSRRLGKK